MSEAGLYTLSHLKIISESIFDLITEVYDRLVSAFAEGEEDLLYDRLVSAFSDDPDPIIPEIQILDIKTDTLRDTDPGAEQERHERNVALPGLIVVGQSLAGEGLAAVLNIIEKDSHLIGIQPNNRSLMDFGHLDKHRRVCLDHLVSEEIPVEASQSR